MREFRLSIFLFAPLSTAIAPPANLVLSNQLAAKNQQALQDLAPVKSSNFTKLWGFHDYNRLSERQEECQNSGYGIAMA
jgi:hypothetical protein